MHALRSYRWPGNVRELQNTIERAVILSENDRPISGAALGIELPAGAVEDVVESDWQPPVTRETGPSAELLPRRAAPAPPPSAVAASESAPVLQSLAEMEKQAILAAMKAKDGNRAQVVELLGISIRPYAINYRSTERVAIFRTSNRAAPWAAMNYFRRT